MILLVLAAICCVCALIPFFTYVRNRSAFLPPPAEVPADLPPVSVLIPARNEAERIAATVHALLASNNIEFEVVVLDDQSTDATLQILQELAASDDRLRVASSRPLPAGWCGKQHACYQLASLARFDELVFLDADVVVTPDAIARAVSMRHQSLATNRPIDLLSGFPRQRFGSFGERLLLPLIQYILLCYLPFETMRKSSREAASAGCGQFFLTDKSSYQQAGGHAAIRESLHDGLKLPRAYRRSGLSTDVFDAGEIASVRMYHGFAETLQGLAKNAVEGVANAKLILPVTFLLLFGHALPPIVLAVSVVSAGAHEPLAMIAVGVSLLGVAASYLPRFDAARRFDRAFLAASLHPLSIAVFLGVQWWAFLRSLVGLKSRWRDRSYSHLPASN